MSQVRTLAQTQVGGRWPRPQFAQRFWHNFLFFAGLLLLSAAAGMIYTRAFGGGQIGASIVHGLIIGGSSSFSNADSSYGRFIVASATCRPYFISPAPKGLMPR